MVFVSYMSSLCHGYVLYLLRMCSLSVQIAVFEWLNLIFQRTFQFVSPSICSLTDSDVFFIGYASVYLLLIARKASTGGVFGLNSILL